MTVLEFSFRNGNRKVKWLDEDDNEHSVNKEGAIIPGPISQGMRRLTDMISSHLHIDKNRLKPVGIIRTTDSDGDKAFTLVGELTSPVNDNVIMAKKLSVAHIGFFPDYINGVPVDIAGNPMAPEKCRIPSEYPNLLTKDEEAFCEDLLEMVGRFATEEQRPEQPSLFDEPVVDESNENGSEND